MSNNLLEASENLKELLTNEELKIPDQSGVTPLLQRAKKNAELSPLSAEAKFEELVVCNLVRYFDQFDQIQFSELESYILVSNFSTDRIVDAFSNYIHYKQTGEDIVFKACVARMIQGLNVKAYTYDFLTSKFAGLENLDAWLYAELIINSNWLKGVGLIEHLLQTDYDASYLFAMLPSFIRKHSVENIGDALSKWYPLLLPDDRQLAIYYSDNYGFIIRKDHHEPVRKNGTKVTDKLPKSGLVKLGQRESANRNRRYYAREYVTAIRKKEVIAQVIVEYDHFKTQVEKQPIFYLTLCAAPDMRSSKKLKMENEKHLL